MALYENFNATNQTCPQFERHEDFVGDIKLPGCAVVQGYDYPQRCQYVTRTVACHENVNLIDYAHFFYCQFNAKNDFEQMLAVFVLLLACALLFVILGTTSDQFFCPPLKVLSNVLGLSENVAGVTLLAFGNSAPDMFACIAGIDSVTPRMYSDLLGAATFVCSIVAGLIIVLRPFKIQASGCVRDIAFLIAAVLYIDTSIRTNDGVSVMESVFTLSLYLVYITVVVVDQYLLTQACKKLSILVKQQDSDDYDENSNIKAITWLLFDGKNCPVCKNIAPNVTK